MSSPSLEMKNSQLVHTIFLVDNNSRRVVARTFAIDKGICKLECNLAGFHNIDTSMTNSCNNGELK